MALIPLPPPPERHPAKRLFQALGFLLVLFLLALAVGEPVTELNDQRHHPTPGRAVKLGENTLHLLAAGTHGSLPTVILDGDSGLPAAVWTQLIKELSQKTLVVAWDRPGYGWSPFGSLPHDGLTLVHELHAALGTRDKLGPFVQSQDLPGPYLLVGQGLGVAHMRIFASEYPDEVAGMVLLDEPSPEDSKEARESRQSQLAGEIWKRRLMIRRLSPADPPSWLQVLSGPDREGSLAMLARVDAAKAEAAELTALDQTLQAAQKLQSLGGKPLRVLTTDRKDDPSLASRIRQGQYLARLSTEGDHSLMPAGLFCQARNELDQPSALLAAINQALGTP